MATYPVASGVAGLAHELGRSLYPLSSLQAWPPAMSQHVPQLYVARSLHPDLCRTSIMINCDTQGYKLKLLLFGTFVALTRYCAGGDNKGKSMKSLAIILAVGMLGAAVPASAFEPASATSVQNRQDQRDYGRWDDRWGARPPAPPRHWTRSSDWYRHVRACQQRYKSYNPRTDTYVPRRGETARCRL